MQENFKKIINKYAQKEMEIFNDFAYSETKKYQKVYGFEIGEGEYATWNNEADTFKHTFMSADLVIRYNSSVSKVIGWGHEYENPKNPAGEKNIDLWNNYVGRMIGREVQKKYFGNVVLKKKSTI